MRETIQKASAESVVAKSSPAEYRPSTPPQTTRQNSNAALSFVIPIRTVPGLNAREHHMSRAKRAKRERSAAYLRTKSEVRLMGMPGLPMRIHLTRVSLRKCDSDNLQGALKHVRDGIADALGIDDGNDAHAVWEYTQERGAWGVRVEIEGAQ